MVCKKNHNNDYSIYIICLTFLLICNIFVFFYIKNNTHKLIKENKQLEKEILDEERKLSIMKAKFYKKYNVETLQELGTKYLHLKPSTVQQIKDINEIIDNN